MNEKAPSLRSAQQRSLLDDDAAPSASFRFVQRIVGALQQLFVGVAGRDLPPRRS